MSADDTNLPSEFQEVLDEMGYSLQSMRPEEGVEKFLQNQESELTPNTIEEYGQKLEYLLEFAEKNDVDDTTEFDGRFLNEFKIYRRDEASNKEGSLSNKTLRDDMYVLRKYLRFLESIDAVKPGTHEKVDVPELDPDEGKRDIDFEADELETILSHLRKYEYATREHAVWILFAATGRRPGCLRSLDLDDLHLDEDEPFIEFRHRKGSTRLKNGKKSENRVNLNPSAAEIIQDYIETERITIEEDDRKPLLTSTYGRLTTSTIQNYVYKWSRPCVTGRECPDDRDPDDCEAMEYLDSASKCPYSKPPVALRHGYISELRRSGVPITIISERCDVGEDIIREHYSELSEDEKRELRRTKLEKHRRAEGGYL